MALPPPPPGIQLSGRLIYFFQRQFGKTCPVRVRNDLAPCETLCWEDERLCRWHYELLQNKRWRWCGAPPPPPPPPIIFEGWNLPQYTIYHWKGNLSKSPTHFRYRQNILISRLYEQFSRSDSAMAPEKMSNFKNMNILLIILKHMI